MSKYDVTLRTLMLGLPRDSWNGWRQISWPESTITMIPAGYSAAQLNLIAGAHPTMNVTG